MKTRHLGISALLGAGFFTASLHSIPANAQARVAAPAINNNTGTATDPQATVPPGVYQSVFADTPTGVEMKTDEWHKANADVGQFKRGHVDILKREKAKTKVPMQPKPTAADAAKPALPPVPQAPGVHKH